MIQPIRPSPRRTMRSAHAKLFGTGDLTRSMRCSVIVAHPGDEIVGAGCLISKLVDVTVLHVTDGAPDMRDPQAAGFRERTDFAEARRQECIAALALANVPEERVMDFGISDRSASYCLARLSRRVTTFLQESAADIVLTHPYEGGHPDHDATAFATHAALRLLKENGLRPPVLFEMALRPDKDFRARRQEFLTGCERETTTLLLDKRAKELKQRMFAFLKTQRESLEVSSVGPERFCQHAKYDFSVPPKRGKLFYENFDWALRSEEWVSLAAQATAILFPATPVIPDVGFLQTDLA